MSKPEARAGSDPQRVWPSFGADGHCQATRDYLHLVSQMLGRRLAMAPPLPEWFHTPLALGAQEITTGAMPWRGGALPASLVLPDHLVRLLEAAEGADGGCACCSPALAGA